MSGNLVVFVGLIYAYVAAEQYLLGNIPMAICYAGYAFANIGLYFALS